MSKARVTGSALAIGASIMLAVLGACAQNGDELLGTVDTPSSEAGAFEPYCPPRCSDDKRSVVDDCHPDAVVACGATEECRDNACVDACKSAEENKSSIGCDYYAVQMDIVAPEGIGACFVSFVTNTFSAPAHISAEFLGKPFDVAKYAKLPKGSGLSIEYADYDPDKGLAPGEVAILFLSNFGSVKCPVPTPKSTGAWVKGTGFGQAFHIMTDVPVVAFQMLPYGGGTAAMTGASLLLPTSSWGTNYVAVNAYASNGASAPPSLDIVAVEDDTTVQITPRVDIQGVPGLVQGGAAGTSVTYKLNKGDTFQISQEEELTGSAITASKRIGLFGGHACMNVPTDQNYCDHAEQQIPPVRAIGNEYAALPHRQREANKSEQYLWRLVGAADGTTLTYDTPGKGPDTLKLGEFLEFSTDGPFTVKSQDSAHPFLLFGYMTGGDAFDEWGDPDFVRNVPPSQWLSDYVFFTDPTYPETSLNVVRKKGPNGFEDVSLDCYGKVENWTPLGSDYETAHVDLVRHNFEPQGKCDNGAHRMTSTRPFGLTVWGWGTGETTRTGKCEPGVTPEWEWTCNVSYAYPAGERVQEVNDVIVGPPIN